MITMPWGRHKGTELVNVPHPYLQWVVAVCHDYPEIQETAKAVLEGREPPKSNDDLLAEITTSAKASAIHAETLKCVRIADVRDEYGLTLEPLDYLPFPEIEELGIAHALISSESLAEHIANRMAERVENVLNGVPDQTQGALHDLYDLLTTKIDDGVWIDLAS